MVSGKARSFNGSAKARPTPEARPRNPFTGPAPRAEPAAGMRPLGCPAATAGLVIPGPALDGAPPVYGSDRARRIPQNQGGIKRAGNGGAGVAFRGTRQG